VAHRVQDAGTEQPVIPRLGKHECLNEVPLSERAGGHAVVAHQAARRVASATDEYNARPETRPVHARYSDP
jgi:hypothetical protein